VRRGDRGEAQNPTSPGRVGHQGPRIEPTHAVANQVHRLIVKRGQDLLAQALGAAGHTGDWLHVCDQHAVARLPQELRDSPEIGGQCHRSQPDPGESKQAVRQNDRSLQPRARQGSESQVCQASLSRQGRKAECSLGRRRHRHLGIAHPGIFPTSVPVARRVPMPSLFEILDALPPKATMVHTPTPGFRGTHLPCERAESDDDDDCALQPEPGCSHSVPRSTG
jgi:hypothetical protein